MRIMLKPISPPLRRTQSLSRDNPDCRHELRCAFVRLPPFAPCINAKNKQGSDGEQETVGQGETDAAHTSTSAAAASPDISAASIQSTSPIAATATTTHGGGAAGSMSTPCSPTLNAESKKGSDNEQETAGQNDTEEAVHINISAATASGDTSTTGIPTTTSASSAAATAPAAHGGTVVGGASPFSAPKHNAGSKQGRDSKEEAAGQNDTGKATNSGTAAASAVISVTSTLTTSFASSAAHGGNVAASISPHRAPNCNAENKQGSDSQQEAVRRHDSEKFAHTNTSAAAAPADIFTASTPTTGPAASTASTAHVGGVIDGISLLRMPTLNAGSKQVSAGGQEAEGQNDTEEAAHTSTSASPSSADISTRSIPTTSSAISATDIVSAATALAAHGGVATSNAISEAPEPVSAPPATLAAATPSLALDKPPADPVGVAAAALPAVANQVQALMRTLAAAGAAEQSSEPSIAATEAGEGGELASGSTGTTALEATPNDIKQLWTVSKHNGSETRGGRYLGRAL